MVVANKNKPIRLSGKKLIDLYTNIYQRDDCCCVMCKVFVEKGTPPHHVTFRSQGGSDTKENGVILCRSCHGLAHGPNAKGIRERLQRYLRGIYG